MSATDPVIGKRTEEFEHPAITDVPAALISLANLEPSYDTPYLTAALDWRPEGNAPHQRQAITAARRIVEHAIAEQEKRSAALESLTADVERITEALQRDLDPSAQGVFIVANSGKDVLDIEPLGLPIETAVTIASIPALKRLAQFVEDYPVHGLLQVDQQWAILTFIAEGLASEAVALQSTLYPRKQQSGAMNQRRYQARANERVEAFARSIADEVRKALEETGTRRVVLSATDVMRPALMHAFHPSVIEKIIGEVRIDIDAPFHEVLEKAKPIAIAYERKREAEQIEELVAMRESSGRGAAGPIEVLTALRNGQVSRVLMTRRYREQGWFDYTMQVFGLGDPPKEHPAGGDPAMMIPVPLEEEIIRQAVIGGAEIEIVQGYEPIDAEAPIPAAGEDRPRREWVTPLDEMGGVAAVLRFTL